MAKRRKKASRWREPVGSLDDGSEAILILVFIILTGVIAFILN